VFRYIDKDQLPKSFGGTADYDLQSAPLELEFRRFVEEHNKKGPVE
jgi:hypothetical protein